MRFKQDGIRLAVATMAAMGLVTAFSTAAMADPANETNTVFTSGLIASVGADALSHVTGNVGINIAAGTGNQQSNSLMIVRSSETSASGSGNPTAATSVAVGETTTGGTHGAGPNSGATPMRVTVASLGAGALANSVGNIGVNIAAGTGNIQRNVIISR